MNLVLKHATAAFNRDSHVDDQVAGDVEAIDAKDLAEAVNDRIRQTLLADGVKLFDRRVADAGSRYEVALHVHLLELLGEIRSLHPLQGAV